MELYTLYSQQSEKHGKGRNIVENSTGEAEVVDDKTDENLANPEDAEMRMAHCLSTQICMTSIASIHSNNTQHVRGEQQVLYEFIVKLFRSIPGPYLVFVLTIFYLFIPGGGIEAQVN